jgi:hypothetical protein
VVTRRRKNSIRKSALPIVNVNVAANVANAERDGLHVGRNCTRLRCGTRARTSY